MFWILRSLRFINESGDFVSLCLRFKCFVVDDEGLEALEDAWENMQQIDVKYGSATRFKTGKAIIKSLSENSPNKEKSTYSVSLEGVGPLTRK